MNPWLLRIALCLSAASVVGAVIYLATNQNNEPRLAPTVTEQIAAPSAPVPSPAPTPTLAPFPVPMSLPKEIQAKEAQTRIVNTLRYRTRRGDTVSQILASLDLCPLWGKKGSVEKTIELNPEVVLSEGQIQENTVISLPVEALPESPDYNVNTENEVTLNIPRKSYCGKIPPVHSAPEPTPPLVPPTPTLPPLPEPDPMAPPLPEPTPVSTPTGESLQEPVSVPTPEPAPMASSLPELTPVSTSTGEPPQELVRAPTSESAPMAPSLPEPTPVLTPTGEPLQEPVRAPTSEPTPMATLEPVAEPLVEKFKQFSTLELDTNFSFTRINETDLNLGTTASLLSNLNYGFDIQWNQRWTEQFTTFGRVGTKYIAMTPTIEGVPITNSSGLYSTLGIGGKVLIVPKWGLTLGESFFYSQEMYFHANPTAAGLIMDALWIPKFETNLNIPVVSAGSFKIDATLKGFLLTPYSTSVYNLALGYGYSGALDLSQQLGEHLLEMDIFYSTQRQNSTIFNQNRTDIGLQFLFKWDLGKFQLNNQSNNQEMPP